MTNQEKKDLFVEAWKTVFDVDEVKDDDNFFEVGGDSMKGVQLVACLAEKGLKLDMLKIYTQPTVEEMAECLEEMAPVEYMQDPSVLKAMETFGIKAEDVQPSKAASSVQPVISGVPTGPVWGIPYGEGYMVPVQMMLYAVPVSGPEGAEPPFPGAVPVSLVPFPINQNEEKKK